ncbi:MAG: SurA N-terminal domain-containing protein [Magnetococcales bacterium]|nr:SurA N-terminal domain-containing protein [Magnetococcales bacterium]
MLSVMRRSASSWMIKLLLSLLALSFVVWGVGDYVTKQQNQPVAEVEGYGISASEFASAYEREYNRLRQASGGAIDKKTAEAFGLKQQTLQNLLERHLISMTGRDLRLRVPQERLRQMIATNPAFLRDGRFDMEQYNIILRNNRLSPQDYERQLSSDLTLEQMEKALRSVSAVPRPIVEVLYRLFREKRTATFLTLDRESLVQEIQPKDEQLIEYMKAHAETFKTPARVKMQILVMNPDSVKERVKASREELQEYYDEHASDYQQEETRRARHILVRVAEDKGGEELAKTRLKAASDRLAKGEAFDKVARELSDDTTAAEGGDLGHFGRGAMVQPFEEAVFAMKPGETSQPVRTDFGFHLIRLEEVRPAATKSLDEVLEEITGKVVLRKAQELVYDQTATLEDQLLANGDFKAIAKDLNLHYQETDFIDRNSDALDKSLRQPKFLDNAFTTKVGETGPLLELGEGVFAAVHVVDRQEPRDQTLEEARQAVRQAFIRDESTRQARSRMEEALKALQGGAPWESVIKAPIREEKTPAFASIDNNQKIPNPVRDQVFRLALQSPLAGKVLEEQGRFFLVKLLSIEEPPADGLDKESEAIANQVEKGLAGEQVGAFLQDLSRQSRIVVHQDMLDKL